MTRLITLGWGIESSPIIWGLDEYIAIVLPPGFYKFPPEPIKLDEKEYALSFPVKILSYGRWNELANVNILESKIIEISPQVFVEAYRLDKYPFETANLEVIPRNIKFNFQPVMIIKGVKFESELIAKITKAIFRKIEHD